MNKKPQDDKTRILLLCNLDHEGILSAISQSGIHYQPKSLHSGPSNWQSIIDTLTSSNVSAAIAKLTPRTYSYIVNEDHTTVRDLLFTHMRAVPHIVYIHEDLYHGTRDSELADEIDYPSDEVCKVVSDLLSKYNITVHTYRKNSELTVRAVEFLGYIETGLMLRLYVPNNQLWANETDRLLPFFCDYLTQITKLNARLEVTRTKIGVIYELRGDPTRTVNLSEEFKGFFDFMNLCITLPSAAEAILRDNKINQASITQILTRYAKEARRIQIDVRQDLEQKILQIRHLLESDLVDEMPEFTNSDLIARLVEQTIPSVLGLNSPMNLMRPMTSNDRPSLLVNVNPQFIQTASFVVAETIYGNSDLTENDRELLSLFNQHGAQRQQDLLMALRELKDESVPKSSRLTARDKILTFLRACAEKAGNMGIELLKGYVEKQLLGP
jgi:hypothetical protein